MKVSKDKGKKGVKPKQKNSRKPLSLKQKLQKESKIVKVDNLNWKAVDIPDNLDDYQGFYGLEEIDGVDVKVSGGNVEFVVKDDSKVKNSDDEEYEEDDDIQDDTDMDHEIAGSEDEDDFKGFDDDNNTDEAEQINVERTSKENKPEKDIKSKSEKSENNEKNEKSVKKDVLLESAFKNVDLTLPDDNDINLPYWEGLSLSSFTLNGLSALKFEKPTAIQKRTIPLAIEGKDVIGKAITGSGKTLAYGIPILERHLQKMSKVNQSNKKIINPPTGIIFAPTRELAHQVVDHLNKIAKFTPLSQHGIVSITGGLSIQKQERLLSHGPGILVATPGRFLELLQKDMELVQRLSCTDIVVLDEADRLLQDGHFDEFVKILELFGKHRPRDNKEFEWKWQTLVFSATFSRDLFGKLDKHLKTNKNKEELGSSLIDNDEILQLLNDKLKFKDSKPTLIDANPKEMVAGQITEALVECGPTERDLYLYYFLLLYPGSTLVFANSIDSVKRLAPFLNNLKVPTFSIHSSMIQKQRLRTLERFKEASSKNSTAVLIASDVAARGLDIPNIDHVAHYHLPRSADVYIHRSGRTGRAGKEGVSVMFCSPQEASGPLRKLRKLVANNTKKRTRLNVHNDVKLLPLEMDLVTQIKPRVTLASKLADAERSSSSTRKEDNWVHEAAEELGIDNLSDIDNFEDDFIKRQRKRKENKALTKDELRSLRLELNDLLSKPIRKNSRRSYLTSGLQNLAHQMVTGNTHKEVLGHASVNALDDLRTKKIIKKKQTKPNKSKAKKIIII
mmetsp:Transcript_5040/g.5595  ORF Transcript_5040/g.5595 Transcript_5040/m.5595 type:complete len:789 (-) Transcript_5040:5-2371(-)